MTHRLLKMPAAREGVVELPLGRWDAARDGFGDGVGARVLGAGEPTEGVGEVRMTLQGGGVATSPGS